MINKIPSIYNLPTLDLRPLTPDFAVLFPAKINNSSKMNYRSFLLTVKIEPYILKKQKWYALQDLSLLSN